VVHSPFKGLKYPRFGSSSAPPVPALGPVAQWDETSIVGDRVTSTVDTIGGITAVQGGGVIGGIVQTTINGLAAMLNTDDTTLRPAALALNIPVPFGWVVVGRFDGQQSGAEAQGHLMDGRSSNNNRIVLRHRDSGGDFRHAPSGQSGAGDFLLPLGRLAVFQCEAEAAGAAWQAYLDGELINTGTHSNQTLDLLTFFGDSSSARVALGVVCEVYVFDRLLLNYERHQLTRHLQFKWGIT